MFRFDRALFLSVLALSTAIAAALSQPSPRPAPLANTVVLIIRHAEKPEDGSGLTPVGEQRARAYVPYFRAYQLDSQLLKLSHLFAAADSTNSRRPRLTIEPLAAALHMKLDLRFTDKDPGAWHRTSNLTITAEKS